MKYCYLDKELAKKGIACCYTAMLDERIDNFIEEFGENTVEFEGEDLPHNITIDKTSGKVRAATIQELYERGEYNPNENEYIKGGVLKTKPKIPKNMFKPEFDIETEKYIEMATKSELLEFFKHSIITLVSEIETYKRAGFYPEKKIIDKLEQLKKDHYNLSFEMALEVENEK